MALAGFHPAYAPQHPASSAPDTAIYPDPFDKFLRVTEFINDLTHDTVRQARQLLYNDHTDICEEKQTLHRERDENALNRFYHSHPFIHERCQILNDHENDWYNEYIHTHLLHGACQSQEKPI